MDLRVLGPIEASVDERPVAIGAGKPRALLAMLALNEGSPVSTERLLDGLWGEQPPATAAKMVQVYVSQLRKALATSGNGAEIVTRGHSYELRLGTGDIDARRFERLLAEGAPRDALALWRGPPLDDVSAEPFAALEIRRLEELRLAAIELAVEQDLAAGRHVQAVSELEALVAQEPLRERLQAQRMLALYRCGRQAEALAAYRQARTALVDAIGVEPGPELRRLHEAILRQDPVLDAETPLVGREPERAAQRERSEATRRLSATAQRAAAARTGLRATEDDLAGDVVRLQAAREREELQDAATDVVACPFKGLASFDVDDADVFFGREQLVAEMVARLVGAPLVGIVGPSGSGKSSVLRAGLLAALGDGVIPGSGNWAIALLRPGAHPPASLEQAIADAPRQGRLVVAVDQFEETFTACRDDHERSAFVDALVAHARDPRRRTLVLLAIRADFYGHCSSFPELWRLLGANQMPVGPMRRDELRRAIELPARRAGLQVEPELVDALIADVEGEPGALPLLSTSLLESWQLRDGRRLHMSAYRHAGGVRGAVARLAERSYEQLDPAQRDVARRILLRLAGEGELVVRRRVALTELEGDRMEGAADVLSRLADDRLVTIDDGEVEVAHEALLREWPRLRGWLDEDFEGRRLHHQLRGAAREWEAGGRDPSELYRGARLASTLDWTTDHEADLNSSEHEFLAESRAASGRAQRRLRAVLAGVAALLVLAVIAGAVALEQRGNARDEATAAQAQRLGARASLDPQLDRALLLARQGVALDNTVVTRGNLLGALVRSPAAIGVIRAGDATVVNAAVTPDGRTLAVGTLAGEVLFFDTRTRSRLTSFEPASNGPAIQALSYSPDGSRLAVAYTSIPGATAEYPPGWRNLVAVVDGRTHRVLVRLAMPPQHGLAGIQFSPDGRTLGATVYGDSGPALRRFDARTGRPGGTPVPFKQEGRLTYNPYQLWPRTPVMFTSDGRQLVVAGEDGVTVQDATTLSVLRSFAAAGKRVIRTQPTAYALSGDDRTLAIGGEDGSLRFLNLSSGKLQTASGRQRGAINEARFTPDGRTLVTAGEAGDVIVWDVRQAASAETLAGHARSAFSPQIADDGRTLYTASLDGTVLKWDLGGERRLGRRFAAGAPDSMRYALSSDGRLLAHGQPDGAISLVEMRTLTRRKAFPVVRGTGIEGRGAVEGIGFVPGSHLLVVGGSYGSVSLVDADRGTVVRRLRGHAAEDHTAGTVTANPIWTPGMNADGSLLVTGSGDGLVRFWSLPDGRAMGPPLRFPYGNADAQLSPNGRWLSVVPLNRDIVQDRLEIWDVRRRRRVQTLRPAAGANDARFSPDGRFLALDDLQGRVQVFSTATWKPVTPSFAGGTSGWLSFSHDSRTLAAGNLDGTVHLWDVASRQALGAPLPGVPQVPTVPIFTPGDTHLIAAYQNGRAYRWDIRPASLVRQACKVAGRRLTRAEWEEFLPERPYAPAC